MIAVSGGQGFVGSRLVERLAKAGPVISIVRGEHIQQVGNCLEIMLR
jgi:nucleoside-diphosphate-sugar epimerase